ncbi:MAG: prephenate dehydrogenase/arogenate dehydrogenase family protein [Ruegeria sp.]
MLNRPEFKTIGLLGCGAFGRLIARHLAPLAPVTVHDPTLNDVPKGLIAGDPAQVAACDLVILAVPVDALEVAISTISPHLRPGTIVADVGSVKMRPVQTMLRHLPDHVGIVGTHPLFGPQSAARGVLGHKIAICRVRGDACLTLAALLKKRLGLRPVMVSPENHDREVAVVQGLTHFISKAISRLGPLPHQLTTVSFDLMVEAADMVRNDPPCVFQAIEKDNPLAATARAAFMHHAKELSLELSGKY